MSWSVNMTGEPEKVIAALHEHGARMAPPYNEEFMRVLPSIVELVNQNRNPSGCLVQVEGNGHVYGPGQSNCNISVKQIGGYIR